MYRAIIMDNLMDHQLKTRACATEDEAITESKAAIKRLCKKFKVAETDGRFILYCTEIES